MKVFVVGTIARQVEGDVVFVRLEKGFSQASNADEYVKSINKTFAETIQVPNVGPVPCYCERGVFEVDVEGVVSAEEGN